MMQREFFLYPVIRIEAEYQAEAIETILHAVEDVCEIRAWGFPPLSLAEERLQQAAPDLLAAAKEAYDLIQNGQGYRPLGTNEVAELLRAAIAKAQGGSS